MKTAETEKLPSKTLAGITFFPVPEFDGPSTVFGAGEKDFIPYRSIPKIPRKYEDMAASIFYNGGRLPDMSPKVDKLKALNALKSWLSSFQPKHECKMATVAYALWVWTTLED